MRRLPGPAVGRLSEGDLISGGSLRIVSGLAENTYPIFCDGSREPEAAKGCPVLREQEPTHREAYVRTRKPDIAHCALSRARPGRLCLSLTIHSHGRRPSGTFDPPAPPLPVLHDFRTVPPSDFPCFASAVFLPSRYWEKCLPHSKGSPRRAFSLARRNHHGRRMRPVENAVRRASAARTKGYPGSRLRTLESNAETTCTSKSNK
jgi:hypothetical protein